MSLALPALSAPGLVVVTALGYVLATVGMKGAASGFFATGVTLAALGFALAFAAEVVLMRQTALSVLYIAILGVETVLILALAFGIGEGFDLRQALGAALVIAGLALVSG